MSESHVSGFPSVEISGETVAPADSLTATSRKTLRQRCLAKLYPDPGPQNVSVINICCFKPLHVGAILYYIILKI